MLTVAVPFNLASESAQGMETCLQYRDEAYAQFHMLWSADRDTYIRAIMGKRA